MFDGNALGHSDQDITVVAYGGYVYLIEKSLGAKSKYDPAPLAKKDMIYQYSVGAGTNPYDIVFVNDTLAYVIRYGSSSILAVNPEADGQASFAGNEIDISMFDSVGVPEAVAGYYHDGVVYVVLQRLNGWTADKPGLLIAVDAATGTLIDYDPIADGIQGCELLVRNPQNVSAADGELFISGHVWGEQTEGIMGVRLDEGFRGVTQRMVLDEESLGMDLTGVSVIGGGHGICYSSGWIQDNLGAWIQIGAAYWFDTTTGTLGDVLPVPTPGGSAVLAEGIVYMVSRDDSAPGLYPVDAATNALLGSSYITTLPPTTVVYCGEGEPILVEKDTTPSAFTLGNPFPNPFNPSTIVSFDIAGPGHVFAEVYNVLGQRVEVLADGWYAPGSHALIWTARDAASGVYCIRVSHAGTTRTVKAALMR